MPPTAAAAAIEEARAGGKRSVYARDGKLILATGENEEVLAATNEVVMLANGADAQPAAGGEHPAGDTGAALNRVFGDVHTQAGQIGKPQAVRGFVEFHQFAVGQIVELLAQFQRGGLRVNRIHDV